MRSLANAMAFYNSDAFGARYGLSADGSQLVRHSHLLMRVYVRVRWHCELELFLSDAPHYHPELSHDTPLPF